MASTDPAPLQGLELHKPAASTKSGRSAHLVVLAIATMGTGVAIRRSAHMVVLAMGAASIASGEAGAAAIAAHGAGGLANGNAAAAASAGHRCRCCERGRSAQLLVLVFLWEGGGAIPFFYVVLLPELEDGRKQQPYETIERFSAHHPTARDAGDRNGGCSAFPFLFFSFFLSYRSVSQFPNQRKPRYNR